MFDVSAATIVLVALLLLVALGIHVAIALGVSSILGIFLVTGKLRIVEAMVASTATEALRDFTFAVIPLFMLMGEFMGRSGAITDVYRALNRGLQRIPGRLALATVLGNAIFSFVTGVSIASAAAFSRIAYPEMKQFGYNKSFALGSIAGSSCLGMLIPPSVLMIVWGILTEQSIGQLFLAGVLPGLLLVLMFGAYVVVVAVARPGVTGVDRLGDPRSGDPRSGEPLPADAGVAPVPAINPLSTLTSAGGIAFIVVAVLGGIWAGFFTPTEGAGAGAALALILAVAKGMRARGLFDAILSVGRTSAPILLLLLTAALFSRTLAMTGVTSAIQGFFLNSGLSPTLILVAMVLVWFILGMVIDSISIMLLTVPIFAPLAVSLGYDQIAFAIVGILAIEAGLLTPPFGLLVYTVKAAIQDESVSIMDIFRGSIPYWIIMLAGIIAIVLVPEIATILPSLLF